MRDEPAEARFFDLPLRCRYLLRRPEQTVPDSMLVIALHGYAMTPEEMLALTEKLVGEEPFTATIIAAIEGPHQLWVNPDKTAESRVGFHWGTSFQAEQSRRMHHDMVLRVLSEVGVPAARAVLVGFSQSVALNYRFICTHPEAVRGVVGICGGIPGDWDTAPYQRTAADALHIATREDRFYSPEVTGRYAERLLARIAGVEYHLLEGGHRIPSAAAPLVRAWMKRLFAPT